MAENFTKEITPQGRDILVNVVNVGVKTEQDSLQLQNKVGPLARMSHLVPQLKPFEGFCFNSVCGRPSPPILNAKN
jgi:hypothetical protein